MRSSVIEFHVTVNLFFLLRLLEAVEVLCVKWFKDVYVLTQSRYINMRNFQKKQKTSHEQYTIPSVQMIPHHNHIYPDD
jgi:hypothetical protein